MAETERTGALMGRDRVSPDRLGEETSQGREDDPMSIRYRDRAHAGQVLALRLLRYAGRPDVIVLALPRGGVPVGFEVARTLGVPLDVLVVRKVGVPGQEELAMGAVASGGAIARNEDVLEAVDVSDDEFDRGAEREWLEVERRERAFRGERSPLDVAGKTVLVVDDGLATGSTMKAAVRALRRLQPSRIIVAVPTAAAPTCRELAEEADECVCDQLPEPFRAVGLWYEDFTQTTDDEVRDLLARSRGPRAVDPLSSTTSSRPDRDGPSSLTGVHR
jgi:predicted phosphoribosyltransferase